MKVEEDNFFKRLCKNMLILWKMYLNKKWKEKEIQKMLKNSSKNYLKDL